MLGAKVAPLGDTAYQRHIELTENSKLVDLSGLQAREHLVNLYLTKLPELKTLSSWFSDLERADNVKVRDNVLLPQCEVDTLVERLRSENPNMSIDVAQNEGVCGF